MHSPDWPYAAGFRCGYCLTSQRVIGPLLEIDHIVPQAQGGTHDEDNLFLACPMCNWRADAPAWISVPYSTGTYHMQLVGQRLEEEEKAKRQD